MRPWNLNSRNHFVRMMEPYSHYDGFTYQVLTTSFPCKILDIRIKFRSGADGNSFREFLRVGGGQCIDDEGTESWQLASGELVDFHYV